LLSYLIFFCIKLYEYSEDEQKVQRKMDGLSFNP
jgi:hypothetical protein